MNQAGYAELRTLPNRDDRRQAMEAFFASLGSFGRTLGTTMNANLQKSRFFAKSRKYGSDLEASLDGPNIPVTVYTRLIDGVNRSLPTFHRYLRLRKRMLGVTDNLHYYDLYAPLVADVDLRYTPEEAEKHVLASIAPLGEDYASVVRRAFSSRWIDFYPTTGKRSGAYSNGGAYDVHPYMLLNYLGQYNDMSTLTHELGHTMHSYYSNKTQPYPTASYQTFVAEVASTFNEALLLDHMLDQIKDDTTRLSLLGNYLENAKSTVFRQTQFAEFELKMHEMAEKGTAITGDALAKLYVDITRRYYGHEQGICIVDDYIAHEWSYIPHFYRDFYVFQYATSFTAAEALSEKVLAGDAAATKRYLTFISSGGSKYPIDLLQGRRCGHDHRRAAQSDDPEDEPGDGRDGSDPRAAREVADARALERGAGRAQRMFLPSAESASSVANSAVVLRTSSVGLTSTRSSATSCVRIGDQLHQRVGLAVVQPTLHRRAHAGRDRRIADVQIERHVDAAGARAARAMARSAMVAMPSRSMSLIVKTCTPDARIDRFSCSSRLRMPTSTVCSGLTAGLGPIEASSDGSRPRSAASGMPCTLPLVVVSGVFMSPCASTQINPSGRPVVRRIHSALAATDAAARLWSPPSTRGMPPASRARPVSA